MKNNIKNISKVIYLLDKHILEILTEKEVDERTLGTLTSIRQDYIRELNSVISSNNTSDMYNKKYWKSFRRP